MKYNTATQIAEVTYQRLPNGEHKLIKDRYGNTKMTAEDAMNSDLRACIVSQRHKVIAVNQGLKEMLEVTK